MKHPQPKGYGRLVLDGQGMFTEIVEEKNATDEERKITLCNSGVIFADKEYLFSCLSRLVPNDLSNELLSN